MAAPELRVVRRRKGALVASAEPAALTAAVSQVVDTNSIFKSAGLGRARTDWQGESWDLMDAVPEFRAYVRWRAGSCSRVRLIASEVDPDTGQPTGSIAEDNTEGQRVSEIVRRIAGGALGQAQLLKRAAECLSVPGEFWIAILIRTEGTGDAAKQVDRWFAVTREEIEKSPTRSDTVVICLPDGQKHEFNSAVDGLFRVWNPHPRKATDPDSPVRACLDPLREIVRTTNKIRNADDSRMNNNGILFVPQEANLAPSNAPVSADKPGTPAPAGPKPALATSLQQQILDVQAEGIKNAGSPASLSPIVVGAPKDSLKDINHVTFGKDVTEVAIKTRESAIGRLAMGLDMSPEQLLGIGSTSNHWNAFLLEDQDVQLYVTPVIEVICQAIYEATVRNVIAAEKIDPAKYVLWYDTSRLTADPDLTDEAKDAFEKGTITAEALVRVYGLPDDAMYDFTTLDGWKLWAQDKVSGDPTLLPMLLPLLDNSIQGIDFPEPQPALPPAAQPPRDEPVTGEQEPGTEEVAGQGSLIAGVSLAIEFGTTRALELAGKRLWSRADSARLRDVAAHEYHRYMDPVDAGEVPKLISGWDAGLDSLAASYAFDAEEVRTEVRSRARNQLTSKVVDA